MGIIFAELNQFQSISTGQHVRTSIKADKRFIRLASRAGLWLSMTIRILLFPWRGTTTLDALRFALRREGLSVTPLSIALGIPAKDRDHLLTALQTLRDATNINGAELAELDENLQRAKYDQYISRELLRQAAAIDRLNTQALPQVCGEISRGLETL